METSLEENGRFAISICRRNAMSNGPDKSSLIAPLRVIVQLHNSVIRNGNLKMSPHETGDS